MFNIQTILVVAGIICIILSTFTRVPLWVGALLIGIGVAVGVF